MIKRLVTLALLIMACQSFAWNSIGHRLVVQIAYDQLTPEAKWKYTQINHALDKIYRPQTLVNAATWLDTIRYQSDINWYDAMHYVNQYFSTDHTPLPSPQKVNAVWAIEHAKKTLSNSKTLDFDKGIALRILIHVVGDLHQPMHGVTQVSHAHPEGDMGGNLFPLGRNPVANNLHAYWDNGAGLFKRKHPMSSSQCAKLARVIEKQWPCKSENSEYAPEAWLSESFEIATSFAYTLKPGQKPDKAYQSKAQDLVNQRIALAGCRLAGLLNKMA